MEIKSLSQEPQLGFYLIVMGAVEVLGISVYYLLVNDFLELTIIGFVLIILGTILYHFGSTSDSEFDKYDDTPWIMVKGLLFSITIFFIGVKLTDYIISVDSLRKYINLLIFIFAIFIFPYLYIKYVVHKD